jgi:hypothetical protein
MNDKEYRPLQDGEVLQDGDEVFHSVLGVWAPATSRADPAINKCRRPNLQPPAERRAEGPVHLVGVWKRAGRSPVWHLYAHGVVIATTVNGPSDFLKESMCLTNTPRLTHDVEDIRMVLSA